ncbi:hypothetical protein ACSFA3_08015 [Variovorax sp. RHLX14]|uniref:hypothetical protein n=1 Tax=Variovorax sp. RHLX14 TaxID=1259731 RepID=UPI003F489224
MSRTFAALPPWQRIWTIQMKITPAAFDPVSRNQPSTTTAYAANQKATTFVRPHLDSAPAAATGWAIVHPNASAAENQLVTQAQGLAYGNVPQLNARTDLFMKRDSKGAPMHETFMMNNEPADVQVNVPRIVITFGSDEKGTAGQVSLVNGLIEGKKGAAMQDPKMLRFAIQNAAVALSLGIARREGNMPYAVAALQELQNAKAQSNESAQA